MWGKEPAMIASTCHLVVSHFLQGFKFTHVKILKIILFVAGVVLLGINISGLFKSLRNEELDSEITTL